MPRKKKKSGVRVLIVILVILIIAAGGILAYKITQDKKETGNTIENPIDILTGVSEEKKVQIYQGNDRPIAVMIDNHNDAWPQAGLNKAYMVYEIIAEGGETRLMGKKCKTLFY